MGNSHEVSDADKRMLRSNCLEFRQRNSALSVPLGVAFSALPKPVMERIMFSVIGGGENTPLFAGSAHHKYTGKNQAAKDDLHGVYFFSPKQTKQGRQEGLQVNVAPHHGRPCVLE